MLAILALLVAPATPTLPSWGRHDFAQMRRLDSAEIRMTLSGKLVSYSAPGWADTSVHEEYLPDGRWRGIQYSRGPISFSGRWFIANAQLCVMAERGLLGPPRRGPICRVLWRDRQSAGLLMAHVTRLDGGVLALTVRPLPPAR